MEIKDIQKFVCNNGIAIAYPPDGLSETDLFEFTQNQPFTYACDKSLNGNYLAEKVELVEQVFTSLNEWLTKSEVHNNSIWDILPKRQFLTLKSEHTPVKQESESHYKGEQFYTQYIGDLLDIFYHRFYEPYSGNASEQDKKEAFYEWLNEQIKDTTY